jgi:hypothetical protein
MVGFCQRNDAKRPGQDKRVAIAACHHGVIRGCHNGLALSSLSRFENFARAFWSRAFFLLIADCRSMDLIELD